MKLEISYDSDFLKNPNPQSINDAYFIKALDRGMKIPFIKMMNSYDAQAIVKSYGNHHGTHLEQIKIGDTYLLCICR